jgi:hypothetical protein
MKCKTGKAIGLNGITNGITNDLLRATVIYFKKYCKYGPPCNMLGTWAFRDAYRDKALGFIGFKILAKLNYGAIFHKLGGAGLNKQQIPMP